MPELPEIETIRTGLSQYIIGQKIKRVTIYSPKLRYPIDLIPSQLHGQCIQKIHRRSKYLLFNLDHHQILCHLGMSGRLWLVENDRIARQPHDHVDIQLENYCLRYHDPRRFGALLMINSNEQHLLLKHLGPEPLTAAFNQRYFYKAIVKRHTSIKQAIMNNHIVVGVGNIYANEALFRAKIHPATLCYQLNRENIAALVYAIKQTLRAAIKAGGTTLKDFSDIKAKPGYFSQQLLVYGREGQPCGRCNTTIQTLQQQGRRSFYCLHCQLLGK